MSTQTRSSGGGRNNNKKANSSGGGGNNNNTNNTVNVDVAASSVTLKSSSSTAGGAANLTTDKDGVNKPQQTIVKIQPTAEQMRIAQITDMNSGYEDSEMKNKVATLIDMTKRSEEDVCCALNECEFDLQKAAEYLLETLPVNAFEISSKKKKNKPSNSESGAGGNDDSNEDWDNNGNAGGDSRREKSRNRNSNRGGGGGGRGGNDSRGWRGREARENERNLAESNKFNDRDGQGGGYRGRGRGGYGGRGGYSGGRGGRGGRMGPRGGDRDRGARSYSSRQPQDQHQEVDTWDNSYAQSVEQPPQQNDEWGDWDNEEYVGSLKDTKVFTPSNMQTTASVVASSMVTGDIGAPPGLGDHQPTDDLLQQQSSQQYSQQVVSSNSVLNPSQFPEIHSANVSSSASIPQVKPSATLSAEQSQYFNSLTSQNTQSHLHQQQAQVHASVQYPTTYGTVFGDPSAVSSQPRRARAKVPPPSKIPASAVEMPGDMLNNASYLEDVQFGFGIEDSAFVEALSDKFASTAIIDAPQPNVQNLQQNQQAADLSGNEYQPKQQMPGGIQSNKIPDSLTSGYSQRAPSNVQQSAGVASMNAAANAALEQLTKNDPYGQSNQSNATGGYQTSYNPNVSSNKVPSYQPAGQGYQNNTSYNNSQSSTGSTYPPQPNSYNSYNQNSVNSYQQANSSVSGGNTGNSTQNIPVGGSGVNNSSATANAGGYLSSQYQSNQSSAFQSQYQNNQSVYGGSAGLSNNTGYSGSTSTSTNQYSNFSSNSKLKESSSTSNSHFESGSNVSSSVVSSTVSSVSNAGASVTNSNMNSSSAASSTLANSSTATTGGAGSSSVSSSAAAAASSNSSKANQSASGSGSGVVQPNIQMVSQYIQAGLPYYQQPVYSYEDITIMQQRMPHVTQYFDVNYTPTSLGAAGVRDGNLGSVAYSPMTDGRFTRTDNNSSPVSNVSNTMSQQAGSSTPMINVPYAYFYGGNMMPGGFQYHGTPAIYPQQMQTANPTSAGQFPKPSYNSGYGSATSYDSLSQTAQDYSKGGYAGTGVNQQTKSQTVSNNPQGGTGSDIASSMYNKAHVALNKVNSYDKQAFHSATPPPFNLSGTQASGTGSTQYGMYIQPMPAAAHHNMNMHQQIHQMDNRIYNPSRRDSNSTGQRQQSSSQSKTGTKPGYSPSYWAGNN